MIIPEYGRCPVCDSAPVVIVRTRRGGMCVACAKAREDMAIIDEEEARLRSAQIRMESTPVACGRMASQMTETIHYEMVRCPICGKKWYDTMDNAHCIRVHGCCLRCRYQPSCVTVETEIEAGLVYLM